MNVDKQIAKTIDNNMNFVDSFINKKFLISIDSYQAIPLDKADQTYTYMNLFKLKKIVYNQNESIHDKLVSVYSALSNFGSTVLLVICSDKSGVQFYVGTRDKTQPLVARKIMEKSFKGNFPGIIIEEQSKKDIKEMFDRYVPTETYNKLSFSSVSIVPSSRSEDDKDSDFVQGVEKFIDAMTGENYTAIFIASPLNKMDLEQRKRGYEELYSSLSQCAQLNITYGESDSNSIANSISANFSNTISKGISDTVGTSEGKSQGKNLSRNRGSSSAFFGFGFNSGTSKGTSSNDFSSVNKSDTKSTTETETTGKSQSDTKTATTGSTLSMGFSKQNKMILELLAKIDEQLQRVKNSESYGLWENACYFVSSSPEVSLVAANTYKALVAGEKTSVESSFTNIWDSGCEGFEKTKILLEHIRYGLHPKFEYIYQDHEIQSSRHINLASMVNGIELPIIMNLPRKSVSGVASISSAEFGRNIILNSRKNEANTIEIGSIYHMGETFSNNRVSLDLDSLTGHCFITGSTGSGKSNTIYKIVEAIIQKKSNVKFLIIEPAKGEYKMDLGSYAGINIFTTNPRYFNMLSLNPFEFNDEVHVLEHIDRLIEIFSACWPLYAAMPALLKASFEKAYVLHGWDLNFSLYFDKGNSKFPTFHDIIKILPELLKESDYSSDTKGDYVGSLVTRVSSLTNGLIGQILTQSSIPDNTLFDQNTIIDLSRIGSAETKSLIMGILVLKLSEYRQSTSKESNIPLKHITVLEEAHHLLKKTSHDQGQEVANLQGKSVEMINNSIAEMRTYGEGFLIVDQSPSSVDIAAIKNTNTKIILRLPETNDCDIVGKSIGLREDQIKELRKLETGVAVLYQNIWLEPVLVKMDCYDHSYKLKSIPTHSRHEYILFLGGIISEIIEQEKNHELDMGWINSKINSSHITKFAKENLKKMIHGHFVRRRSVNDIKDLSKFLYQLLNCEYLFYINEDLLPNNGIQRNQITDADIKKIRKWGLSLYNGLDLYAHFFDKKTKDIVFLNIILHKIQSNQFDDRYALALLHINE